MIEKEFGQLIDRVKNEKEQVMAKVERGYEDVLGVLEGQEREAREKMDRFRQ